MDKTKITDIAHGPVSGPAPDPAPTSDCDSATKKDGAAQEIGGRIGPDPTRFGDWEKAGRCIDF
ncbi:MAG: DUF1674 domain-containing protein [Rhodospirillales bacterium]|nr:DUF1674 domain-containing protein [Rhodospirillales bacterium]